MIRISSLLPAVLLLGACAGTPIEDTSRVLSFSWDLTPEHFDKSIEHVEQGDIFFEWTATTPVTHEATINGATVYLGQAATKYGNLYCSFGTTTGTCYEDRDADGSFERRWTAERNSRSPSNITYARLPEDIQPPIAFRTSSVTDKVVAKQTLGLLYNGPTNGSLDENGAFTTMFGELALGWYAGKSEPRDPTGLGWKYQNSVIFAVLPDFSPEVVVKELGLRYTALKATMEGGLEIEYQAVGVDGVNLDKKFDLDIEKRDQPASDPEV